MLNMAVYGSGRSFHVYSTTLLGPKDWFDFMGRLLLINPRGQKEIVDTCWIGHRLIGGFGSLRWSNNSGMYLGSLSRISFPRIVRLSWIRTLLRIIWRCVKSTLIGRDPDWGYISHIP